jgi:hypothetical protein
LSKAGDGTDLTVDCILGPKYYTFVSNYYKPAQTIDNNMVIFEPSILNNLAMHTQWKTCC